jgi:hypothetical protein
LFTNIGEREERKKGEMEKGVNVGVRHKKQPNL